MDSGRDTMATVSTAVTSNVRSTSNARAQMRVFPGSKELALTSVAETDSRHPTPPMLRQDSRGSHVISRQNSHGSHGSSMTSHPGSSVTSQSSSALQRHPPSPPVRLRDR